MRSDRSARARPVVRAWGPAALVAGLLLMLGPLALPTAAATGPAGGLAGGPARGPAGGIAATGPIPAVTCVTTAADGSYRAVFGYSYPGGTPVDVPVGATNRLSPGPMDGTQPTRFAPGDHPAAFVAPSVARNVQIVWDVLGRRATAASGHKSPECASPVTLPTEGNSIGPVLVLVVSVLFSTLLTAVWRSRRGRRS